MNKVNFRFQNMSIHPGVTLENKMKISNINYCLNYDKAGFTCFNLFQMSSYTCLLVS